MTREVRPVEPADLRRLAAFLGGAFAGDPAMRYFFPEAGTREGRVARLQARGVAHGRLYGAAETTDEVDGVIVWFRPGARSMSLFRILRSGLIWVPWKLGPGALARLTRYYSAKKRLRASCGGAPDQWYLFLLAVDPERHGQRIGSALLEHGLGRIDAESRPCYLETSREENVAYFRRFGFEVRAREEVRDPRRPGPYIWGMVRPASARGC